MPFAVRVGSGLLVYLPTHCSTKALITHWLSVLMDLSVPFLQVRSDSILFYEVSERPRRYEHDKMTAKSSYSGLMQYHTRKRVVKAVDMLLQRSPNRVIWNPVVKKNHDFRIGFCTLTIPAQKPVSAKFAHANLLQPFLRTARRKWGVSDYLWKAELQERGQLHYHISWNKFVDLTSIRNEWNNRLRKFRLTDEYAMKYGHHHPNSTDIHAVWKVRNLKAYLAKYIAKEEQNRTALNGKIWDCSRELKRKPFSVIMEYRHMDILEDAVANNIAKKLELEHCILFKMANPLGVLNSREKADYKQQILC